ncbi:HalOD1 output domain-containing protein [Haladaptatus caseinilyticus]|uniref:HalOD1 output domain-containing protein n=1 Tax=Haladaptatus caseinilyticus TaxID=2993314 RepID=UPI00224B767C|nr:HalOD1 output domain-containing protein [Haladaptatus caseinilyticus]
MTRSSDNESDDEHLDTDTNADGGEYLVEQAHYERAGRDDLTTTIIGAIAAAEGVSPRELKEPVLYDCVDIAALEDSFFGPTVAGRRRNAIGSVEFHFGEYRVEVKSDGWVSVYGES